MSPPIPTVPEVLSGAADLIKEHGLARERFRDGEKLCALGAIAVAVNLPANAWATSLTAGEADRYAVAQQARTALKERIHGRFMLVSDFSDASSPSTVIAALRAAAKEAAS